MECNLTFSKYVSIDLQFSINWYENEKKGLGKRFYNEALQQFKFIRKHPLSAAIKYHDVHCSKLNNFPFLVHYKFISETREIHVFAVFHTHSYPSEWENRL
jgi:hypothetical protein